MRTYLRSGIITLGLLIMAFGPTALLAQTYNPQPINFDPNNNVARNTGFGNASPVDITAGIMNWILGILALVALALVFYGGAMWIFSGGDPEKVARAKDILIGAFIGVVIILVSYSLTQYIFSNLVNITTNGPR